MQWGVRKREPTGANVGMSKKVSDLKNTRSAKTGSDAAIAFITMAPIITLAVIPPIMNYRDSGRKDARKTADRPFKEDKSLTGPMSVAQLHAKVVKPINPDFGAKGTKMNCRRATMAYEMRRRGYDVKATKSNYASGQTMKGMQSAVSVNPRKAESLWGEKAISDVRTLSRATPQQKAELIFADLAKNPNGARGELAVGWTMGGGHSIAFEIVNKKPVIFDTQSGDTYDSPSSFAKFTPVVYEAAQTRLDNKPINNEFIKRWVTDVE